MGYCLRRDSTRSANVYDERLRGSDTPARDCDDIPTGAGETRREPRARAARADEAELEFRRRHLPSIVRGVSLPGDRQGLVGRRRVIVRVLPALSSQWPDAWTF